jgi:acyl dehydratase
MRIVGLGWPFAAYEVGMRYRTVGRTITETDVIGFVNVTNLSEPAFTNRQYQDAHPALPGRLVPGALCYCLSEGLLVQATLAGAGVALLELEQKLLKPVFIGDTIHVEVEVRATRATSKGDRGVVTTLNSVVNQKSEITQTYRTVRMILNEPFAE